MKKVIVEEPGSLYQWAKNFKRVQDRFYEGDYKLRRIQEIEDFIRLNGYQRVLHVEETWLDLRCPGVTWVEKSESADLILVTHQGYSRLPCSAIIDQIEDWTSTSDLYLCLNRHYLNIDNQPIDLDLDDDFQVAIGQWLRKSLSRTVIDLSRYYTDRGKHFTWSVPDRHFFISRRPQ